VAVRLVVSKAVAARADVIKLLLDVLTRRGANDYITSCKLFDQIFVLSAAARLCYKTKTIF
jgi:hypothetical protein